MLGVCKVRWLVIIAVCGMILSAFAGCGTAAPSNDDDDPLDQGENDRDDIDWDSLHTSQRGFRDGQNLKMSLWQKVDGEESSGWITVAVSESDGEFDFEYAGELGDYEFSNTCSHPGPNYNVEDGRFVIAPMPTDHASWVSPSPPPQLQFYLCRGHLQLFYQQPHQLLAFFQGGFLPQSGELVQHFLHPFKLHLGPLPLLQFGLSLIPLRHQPLLSCHQLLVSGSELLLR